MSETTQEIIHEPKTLGRRAVLKGFAAVITSAFLPVLPASAREARASAAVSESAAELLSPAELIQQPAAVEHCRQLFEVGKLTTAHIGWVDSMPMNADLPAFAGVIDREHSKSYAAGVAPFSGEDGNHGTWALQFATQSDSGGYLGLSQKEWSKVTFTNLFGVNENAGITRAQDVANYVAAIDHLRTTGATVIGTIPTWRDSNFTDPQERINAYAAITAVFAKAAAENVIIVIPAGNANVDLSVETDKRILHEIAKEFANVLVVGGVDQHLQRAQWTKDTGEVSGSNYGRGYVDVESIATNRIVPWANDGFATLNGTTFCVGDVVSLVAILQNMHQTKTGILPQPELVKTCMSETGRLVEDQKITTLIQMDSAITAMERFLYQSNS